MSQSVEQVARRVLAEASRLAIEHPDRALEILKALTRAVKDLLSKKPAAVLAEADVKKRLAELRTVIQDNDARADAELRERNGR